MGFAKGIPEKSKLRFFLAVLVGAALGTVLSFLVNSALVEISLNPFFSFYFGLLFGFVGTLIIYRVKSQEKFQKGVGLLVFGCLVLLSGL